jgi:hypothetical protein
MNFSPADIDRALRRGIGPQDPRFLPTLQENKNRRQTQAQDMRVAGALAGSQVEATYPRASAWLQANPELRAPMWLGHEPKTTTHKRGTRKFVHFEAAGIHKSSLFEIQGKTLRRIL